MIKKYLFLTFIIILFSNSVYSTENAVEKDGIWNTGVDDISHMKGKNSNFKKGKDALKQAKRYEKKRKFVKAKKRFNDAIKFFTLANDQSPNNPDILSYLGYSLGKVGDFLMAEIRYEQGLKINPQHIGINEYLGELYVETKRIDKAKERLKVLENCKCEEFEKLRYLIFKY